MKTIKSVAASLACLLVLASCTKPVEEKTVSWVLSSTSAVFNLGESKTISATAENIDYVEVSSKPEGWTVNATVSSVTIKAPAGTENKYVLSGKVELTAVNREQSKNIPVLVDVSVDESKIKGVLEITSDVKYTTVFQPGESKDFTYTSAFLKSVKASCGSGWKAVLDESAGKLTVTAPTVGANIIALSSTVILSGESVTGEAMDPSTFEVAVAAYLVKASDFAADAKAFGITDADGIPVAFGARTDKGFDVYIIKNKTYLDPIPLESEITFLSDGFRILTYEGNPLPTTVTPYTVKDADGNEYPTAMIRGNVWTDRNLKVTKTPKGVAIEDTKAPDGQDSNIAEYGRLYNKTQAFDGATPGEGFLQGICPDGWHIPTVKDISDIDVSVIPEGGSSPTDEKPDAALFASLTAKPAGIYMAIPQMGVERAIMFGQFSTIQVAHDMFVAAAAAVPSIPGMDIDNIPKSIEFQSYPAYYVSVRCVKDVNPFLESTSVVIVR